MEANGIPIGLLVEKKPAQRILGLPVPYIGILCTKDSEFWGLYIEVRHQGLGILPSGKETGIAQRVQICYYKRKHPTGGIMNYGSSSPNCCICGSSGLRMP